MSETEYIAGTTVILQAIYYNAADQPIDADGNPTVVIKDKRNRTVQTGLVAEQTAVGTYQCKYRTTELDPGVYFYIFTAQFDGYQDKQSDSFKLVEVLA